MIEKSKNKIIEKGDTETKEIKGSVKSYFFPDYGVSVKATSKKEAEEKLLKIIKK